MSVKRDWRWQQRLFSSSHLELIALIDDVLAQGADEEEPNISEPEPDDVSDGETPEHEVPLRKRKKSAERVRSGRSRRSG